MIPLLSGVSYLVSFILYKNIFLEEAFSLKCFAFEIVVLCINYNS